MIEVGLAQKERVGAGTGAPPTLTVTLSKAEPPGPEQLAVYVLEEVKLPVDWAPEVPVHPEGETVHDVVFEELHLIVVAVL